MIKFILLLSVFVFTLSSSRAGSALEALNTVIRNNGTEYSNLVISIAGKGGTPVPRSWALLAYDKQIRGILVHAEVANGRAVRSFRLTPQDSAKNSRRPLSARTIRIDSPQIFARTERLARKAGVPFDSVDYLLIFDDRVGQPIYKVDVIRAAVGVVGEAVFSAVNGGLIFDRWSPAVVAQEALPVAKSAPRLVIPQIVRPAAPVVVQPRFNTGPPGGGFLGR